MSQSAAFYVIGVVGQFDLHAMIDSTLQSSIFLVDKGFEQRRCRFCAFTCRWQCIRVELTMFSQLF